jgi:hypothetical protein
VTTTADWDAIDWAWIAERLIANWPWVMSMFGFAAGVIFTLIALTIMERLDK